MAAWPGSALGSRPELRGQGRQLLRWAPLVVAGSAAGAALLLVTPERVFDQVVPFLLAAAAIILLVQPAISAWLARRNGQRGRFLLPGGLIATAAYDGYWGAGAGVMILALLMITLLQPLPQSNALKNMLLGVADVTCCILFIAFWPIDWTAAAPLACGFLIGSVIGPAVARRVPGQALRVVAALTGLGLAGYLWAGQRP